MNCDFKGIYCAPLLGVFLVTLQAATVTHLAAQTTEIPFLVNNGGVDSETSAGTASEVSIGYARIQPASGRSTPSGVAIFGLRQDGVLVSETGVPASPSISSGRIYAEVNGPAAQDWLSQTRAARTPKSPFTSRISPELVSEPAAPRFPGAARSRDFWTKTHSTEGPRSSERSPSVQTYRWPRLRSVDTQTSVWSS